MAIWLVSCVGLSCTSSMPTMLEDSGVADGDRVELNCDPIGPADSSRVCPVGCSRIVGQVVDDAAQCMSAETVVIGCFDPNADRTILGAATCYCSVDADLKVGTSALYPEPPEQGWPICTPCWWDACVEP